MILIHYHVSILHENELRQESLMVIQIRLELNIDDIWRRQLGLTWQSAYSLILTVSKWQMDLESSQLLMAMSRAIQFKIIVFCFKIWFW